MAKHSFWNTPVTLRTQGIVWLSSYPKSGNTWFRIVLSHVLNRNPKRHPIHDIDAILGSQMLANRSFINNALGMDSTLLTLEELDNVRPLVYQRHAKQLQETAYIKIHDAYTQVKEGCLKAVYFIRNPLDVAVSMAHHVRIPLDWVIQMMANEAFAVPLDPNDKRQIRQKLLSWSSHVKSWTQQSDIPVLVLRYEDMFFEPTKTFQTAMDFLNIEVSPAVLNHAIDEASFAKLQQYETQFGFKEKPTPEGQFFRKGIVGDWENTLTKGQVQKIVQDHGVTMDHYRYLQP